MPKCEGDTICHPYTIQMEDSIYTYCTECGKDTGVIKVTDVAESDPVNPDHYKMEDGRELIDWLRQILTPEEFRGGCKMQVLQYVARERQKGGEEDLKKAIWYLEQLT